MESWMLPYMYGGAGGGYGGGYGGGSMPYGLAPPMQRPGMGTGTMTSPADTYGVSDAPQNPFAWMYQQQQAQQPEMPEQRRKREQEQRQRRAMMMGQMGMNMLQPRQPNQQIPPWMQTGRGGGY